MKAYSIPEVAEIASLSRQAVYDHVINGHIPCIKISSRTWRIPGVWVQKLTAGEGSIAPDTSNTTARTTVSDSPSLTKPDTRTGGRRGKGFPK